MSFAKEMVRFTPYHTTEFFDVFKKSKSVLCVLTRQKLQHIVKKSKVRNSGVGLSLFVCACVFKEIHTFRLEYA